MPIYEYRCDACGHELEELQKLSDPPLVDCPACGKPKLVKKVSAAGFQLKGSGWYATDFRGKKNVEGRKEEGSGAGADLAKPEAKPEAKPDIKPETKKESTTVTQPVTKPEPKP